MVVVPGVKIETSSVIPVIGGSNAAVVSSIKNVMEDDPSIVQVKQEDNGIQESPFLRIMGWLFCIIVVLIDHTYFMFYWLSLNL